MRYSQFLKIFSLSLSLALMTQLGHSAAIKPIDCKTNFSPERTSLMEKALQQQKQGSNIFHGDSDIKVLTEFKITPSQSFLAAQNQKFSRLVQAIFTQNNS